MYSYARNLTALFGTMRTQLAPLPLNMPATPSFLAMWKRPCHVFLYIFVLPCTCIRIFRRSNGATAVRDSPPAMPPAARDLAIDDQDGRGAGLNGTRAGLHAAG